MSWPQVKLESVFEIARGGSPRPIDDYITDANDGLNWISIKDASNSNKYIETTRLKIKPEGLSKTRLVKPGDFLLTNSMSFGRPYIMKTTGCIHDGWLVLSGDPERVDSDYFYHLLGSDLLKRRFSALAAGAVVKNLNIDLVKGVEIPLPPLPEQKRIAAILDKADAIRRKRQQAIGLADDFLRAVFLDMFGDVIEGAENIVSFSDIAVLDAPMVDPRDEEYIDLIHIGPDRIEKKIGKLLPALTAREERLISKKFLFDDRYVLYSKIRPYLRKCAMAEGVGLCSADMYPVRPVEGIATKEFLWMLLLSDFFTGYTESLPARANIPKLNREELEAFTLSLPDYREQLKFSSIVRAANTASQRVVESAAYADGAFESLSQKAFSGQL
ncbi:MULTISPECIES: restriction endonuclease subunit S [Pseudomonas]|uniref:Type I restriction enzyme, S subunit n=1 Tax=Pseudomonas lutea TaxID=243924 RepID=A0A9X8MHH6_9PSED|nr:MULTISPECIES: restriction endonuclease subunit S [Pseudomonas]SER43415.1 type I restriction enzyme, S subunit [Pseudomonas lutea]